MKIRYQAGIFLGAVLSLVLSQTASAQKEVLYSQYLINPISINPAAAGSAETFQLSASLRRKWFGIRNAPLTQTVSVDGAVANGRVGLGFQALNDRMGLFAATGAYGSVAYRFNMPALAKLSIGVQGGVSVLPLYDYSTAAAINRPIASLGLGIYYKGDRFFGGLSVPELVGRALDLSERYLYQSVRPVMLQAGTRIDLSDKTVLIPSVLVSKIAERSPGVDLNARVWINEQLGLGLSYRYNSPGLVSANYLYALAEFQISNAIRLGYTFYSQTPENPTANLYFQPSTHEVTLRFTPNALTFTY
ncbi:type IX secretion system membrane protein PorP/SprF [Spirosoma sp. KUDC1026]|uniref:PorP/SprF family type IX secretion system membrane protein n=1 Tax=Spirosoma sp. KUDC1026 TaxID=2745947 RepID=UPI00159B99BC|nr:type IX secretion system membrane protein PorP/SprF [Spirosoma sp. KUDC1026]QKZ15340.1 type IX secretion system membrane protein PorP/SprF [Spirosoma sp. KUDC1026]